MTSTTTITSSSGSCSLSLRHSSSAIHRFNHPTPTTFTSSRHPTLTSVRGVVGSSSGVTDGLRTTSHVSAETPASLPGLHNFPVAAAAALSLAVFTCTKTAAGMWDTKRGGRTLLQTKSVRCDVRNTTSSVVVLALSALQSICSCAGAAAAPLLAPMLVSSASARGAALGPAGQPALPLTLLPSLRHGIGACGGVSRVPDGPAVECPAGAAAATGSPAAAGGWTSFSAAQVGAVAWQQRGIRRVHSISRARAYRDSSTGWCCASSASPPAEESSSKLSGVALRRKERSFSASEKLPSFGGNKDASAAEQSGIPSARHAARQRRRHALRGFSMPWLREDSSRVPGTRRGGRPADTQSATEGGTGTASFQPGDAWPLPGSVPPAPEAGGHGWLRTPPVLGSVAAASHRMPGAASRALAAAAARTNNSAAVEGARQRAAGEALRSAPAAAEAAAAAASAAAAAAHSEAVRRGGKVSKQQQGDALSPSREVHAAGGSAAADPADGDRISERAARASEAAGHAENEAASGKSSDRGEVSGAGEGDSVGSASTLSQTSLHERPATHAGSSHQREQSHPELRRRDPGKKEAKAVEGVREEEASPGPGTRFARNSEGGAGASERHPDAAGGSLDGEPLTAAPAAAPAAATAGAEADSEGTPEGIHGRAVGATVAAFIEQNREAVESGDVKVLLLMRHAQSEYNLWRAESVFKPSAWRYDQGIKDVGLTDFGVQQCLRARQELLSLALALPPDMAIDFHLTSPLMRAVQTAVTSFPCPQASLEKSGLPPAEADADLFPPRGSSPAEIATRAEVVDRIRPAVWILTPLLRERLDTSGDVGSEKDQLLARAEDLEAKKVLPSGCSFISSSLDASLLPQRSMEGGDRCSSWCMEMPPGELTLVRRRLPMLWTSECGTSERSEKAVTQTDSVQQQVLQALLQVHDFSEQAQRDRQALWRIKTASLWNSRFFRKVPLESADSVFARMRLVLAAICQVRDARIAAMVGHSVSFVILTHASKMRNAQVLPFVLDCKAKTIAPLLLEEPGKVGRPASTRFPSEETLWERMHQKLKQLNGI